MMCCSLPLLLLGFVKVNEVGDGNDDSQKVPSVTYTEIPPQESGLAHPPLQSEQISMI